MTAILTALLPTLLGLLQMTPSLVNEIEQVIGFIKGTSTISTDQQAAIDAALDAAHQALQDS